MSLARRVGDTGVSALAAGLKTMLPSKRETPVTRGGRAVDRSQALCQCSGHEYS